MYFEREKGIALVIVVGIVLLLMIAAACFMLTSLSEIKMARMQNDSTRAFYIAEAGLERAHYDLEQDDDWTDGDINGFSYTKTDGTFTLLGYDSDTKTSSGGEFTVWLKGIAGSTDTIWIKSKGTYNNSTRVVQAKAKPLGGTTPIDKAMRVEGAISIGGASHIVPEGSYVAETLFGDDYFEAIFGVDKTKMEEMAQNYYHYDSAIHDDAVHTLTWVNGGETLSQITHTDGDGILIVNGDIKITGGTFTGIIWITGTAEITAGNPHINGAVFVECGSAATSILGAATITYVPDAITDALSLLIIESWQEVSE